MLENNILFYLFIYLFIYFFNLEVEIKCSFLFSHSFTKKNYIHRINLITFGLRPTGYFQTAGVESRLNLAKIALKC